MLAVVESIRSDGVFLRFIDGPFPGQTAWLPAEEWDWDESGWEEASELLEPGEALDVIAMSPAGPEGAIEVSRRRFGQNHVDQSWLAQPRTMTVDSFSDVHILGRVGNVLAVMNHQSYLQHLSRRNLGPRLLDHAEMAQGDTITGLVSRLHSVDGAVELDFGQYLDSEDPPDLSVKTHRSQSTDGTKKLPAHSAIRLPTDLAQSISPVLLVEDNDACRYAIEELLKSSGVDVWSAKRRQDVHDIMSLFDDGGRYSGRDGAPSEFRLAIIDPNLGDEGNDFEGLEIVRRYLQSGDCRVLLASGEGDNERKLSLYGDLRVHCFLAKPFTTQSLIEHIEATLAVGESTTLRECFRAENHDQVVVQDQQDTNDAPIPEMTLESVLRKLVSVRSGTVIHVFELHHRSYRANSVCSTGRGLRWEPFKGKIGKSPIKDAAMSSHLIVENVSDSRRSHLWTLSMMPYHSFCGVPLGMLGCYLYVLAAFHPEPNAFGSDFMQSAQLCGEQIARILERRMLRQMGQDQMRAAFMGMALQSLAHEIGSELTAQDSDAVALQTALRGEGDLPAGERLTAYAKASRLEEGIAGTIEKANLLRGTHTAKSDVTVQSCLRRAVIGCRKVVSETGDLSSRVRIALPEETQDDAWCVRATPAALVIVFFNLYLNAAQQLGAMAGIRRHGRIWHSLERRLDARGRPWAIVRVHDTGPGIHRDDWERVFEPGYTTKEHGTGLGLYICRNLLRETTERGRVASVRVTRSVMWEGTTFTVRLPLLS